MMVGNSLKSDIVPAIAAGSWGVYIPHDLNWVLEHAEEPADSPRYRRLEHLGELAGADRRDRLRNRYNRVHVMFLTAGCSLR